MRKLLIPFFLILLLVLIPGCKKDSFDIQGTWNIHIVYQGGYEYDCTVTFAGSETSGVATCTCTPHTGNGLYNVSGSSVTFDITWVSAARLDEFTGTKSDDNRISGTLWETPDNITGTWIATR